MGNEGSSHGWRMSSHHLVMWILLFLVAVSVCCAEEKVYVVYFGEHTGERTHAEIEETHLSYLLSVKETEGEAKSSLLYSYKHSINGFSARLTPSQAAQISKMEEVVSVYESAPWKYSLHTTRSWEFSGVEVAGAEVTHRSGTEDLLLKSKYGSDVVVGVVDTGVWPESESFDDRDVTGVPKSWIGICQTGEGFNSTHCNRKIIGARYYIAGYEAHYGPLNRSTDFLSPRDKDGHGTHTASTAAGRQVQGVSAIGGYAAGTASGGAPRARLAIYKVCWPIPGKGKEDGDTCIESDILAAIDQAIADGVHVLSISIGTKTPTAYLEDGIAIGSFHALKKNIVVSCSAGNNGPGAATLANTAPWIITVGASSVDREFISSVTLGNGMRIPGQTVTPYKLNKFYPLIRGAQAANSSVPTELLDQCMPGSLMPEKATGKIVFCMRGNGTRVGKGMEVKRAGGIGYVLGNGKLNGDDLVVDAHVLPATAITYKNSLKILEYINSNKDSTAYITPSKTVIGTKPAPTMASFSSRGPNTIFPDILKPDITGPGLNILAAWSEASSPTRTDEDKRSVKYNILSGTSMSCPHISGAAVLLKAIHPNWSSAAIRSALITTAGTDNNEGNTITDATGQPANPFQFGGGHFRPVKAADPGLVYDASYVDYLLFLCGNSSATKPPASLNCPANPPTPGNLNYPSVQIPYLNDTANVVRTVTNVGSIQSTYYASTSPPPGVTVKIYPPVLHFSYLGQAQRFTITISRSGKYKVSNDTGNYVFGWYKWFDGIHSVRSPIAVKLA